MSNRTFQDHWKAFKAVVPLLLLVSVVAAGVAVIIVRQLPPVHQAHFSYLVSLATREQSGEYQFDGYYALQATDLFTSTLAGWIQAPEMIAQAYRAADLELSTNDPRQLVSTIEARKVAPQLVEVTIRETDSTRAGRLIEGLTTTLTTEVTRYQADSIPGLVFKVTATEPWHGQRTIAAPVVAGVTFVCMFFLLVNGWLLFVAFAPEPTLRNSSV